jgi:type IV fimbrial biogenesis protein FimT
MQRNATRHQATRLRGLSLLELLVTLGMTGMVLLVGVPAIDTLHARTLQTAEINRFIRHLQLARSSAIKSGRDHVLCPSNDSLSCLESTRWEYGYILFEDGNEDEIRDRHESIIGVGQTSNRFGIAMRSTMGRKHIIYRADGRSAGSNLTLTFCDPENDIPPKAVILSNSGRPRVAATRWDGSPLTCGP